jgi:hypothetical protein
MLLRLLLLRLQQFLFLLLPKTTTASRLKTTLSREDEVLLAVLLRARHLFRLPAPSLALPLALLLALALAPGRIWLPLLLQDRYRVLEMVLCPEMDPEMDPETDLGMDLGMDHVTDHVTDHVISSLLLVLEVEGVIALFARMPEVLRFASFHLEKPQDRPLNRSTYERI